jgi:hypothetical protein
MLKATPAQFSPPEGVINHPLDEVMVLSWLPLPDYHHKISVVVPPLSLQIIDIAKISLRYLMRLAA